MVDDTEKETIGSSKSAFYEMVFIHTSTIQSYYLVNIWKTPSILTRSGPNTRHVWQSNRIVPAGNVHKMSSRPSYRRED